MTNFLDSQLEVPTKGASARPRRSGFAAILAAVLLLAGCSTPQLNLKGACDELGPIMKDFGQVAPTADRYAEYAPKVKAVMERADADTRPVVAKLAELMEAGAAGREGAVWEMVGASIALTAACATAGSTGYVATPAASATPTQQATTVNGLFRVEGDWIANTQKDYTTIDGPCLVGDGYSDVAEGASVTVRDGEGSVVGMGELMNPRLAVESGKDAMSDTFCELSFSVEAVPQGRKFYSVTVGTRGEVDFTEAELFDDPVLTLGDLP